MSENEWRSDDEGVSGMAMLLGSGDPADGVGTSAEVGSLYVRRAESGSRTYRKFGVGSRDWAEIMVSERCNVRAFGAKGDGGTDDTAAVRSALAACQSGDPSFGSELYFPSGRYLITDTLRITEDRIHIRGDGLYVSTIDFRPRASRVLFDFGKLEGVLYQCSVADLSLMGSGVAQKIAVRATDTSVLSIDNVSTRAWNGGGTATPSIALQLRGRELLTVRRVTLFADRPISIEDNPRSTIDLDHAHFQDLYLGAEGKGESSIVIAPGINLTNIVIDGTNAFVSGVHGIVWNDTVGKTTSMNLRFSNIRTEQSQRASGYAVWISHYVQNVLMENICADSTVNGFLLHGVRYATLMNCIYAGNGVALDIDSRDNYDVALVNCFFQAESRVKTTQMREGMSLFKSVTQSPVAPITFFAHGSSTNGFITMDGARRFARSGRLERGESRQIPFPVGGTNVGLVQLAGRATDGSTEAGSWALTESSATRIAGTPHTADVVRPNTLCLSVTTPGTAMIVNNLAQPITFVLSIDWASAQQ